MPGHHGVFDGGVGGVGEGVEVSVETGGKPGAQLDCGEGGEEVDVGFGGVIGWGFGEVVEVEGHGGVYEQSRSRLCHCWEKCARSRLTLGRLNVKISFHASVDVGCVVELGNKGIRGILLPQNLAA